MHRYKLILEYDGTQFFGWQRQTGQISVQEVLETAIQRFCGETVTTQAAGRTDTGVHALGQVVHFDLGKDWDPFRVGQAINYHLKPWRVAVVLAEAVGDDFEARFSALARHYQYRILNRRARPALDEKRVWQVGFPLDAGKMHEAAQMILGRHDFTTFRAAECQAKSPIRTLDHFAVERQGEVILVTAHARSFLHHQVRSMVGSLRMVGEGRWEPARLRQVLDARDRSQCASLAPPEGLYLTKVDY